MREIRLDMRRMGQKHKAHVYLARKLEAPAYYGGNLDALFDVLSSLPPCRLVLRYSANRPPESYQARLLKVFTAAALANPGLEIERR